MKICWDTLEYFVYSLQNQVFKKSRKDGYAYYEESDVPCKMCGCYFLKAKFAKKIPVYCSIQCRMSDSKTNPMYGKSHSEETKYKMRLKRTGTKSTKSTRAKLSLNNSGKGNPNWKGGVLENDIPLYDTFYKHLGHIETFRRSSDNPAILEAKCTYCGKFFSPSPSFLWARLRCISGAARGEGRLYCSEGCKLSCPIYRKHLWPADFKPATSREVQPELRQLVLERDNWQCQKCGKGIPEVELHCHHILSVAQNPLESADIDNCIAFCKKCHKEVHKQDGCEYNQLKEC